MTGAHPPFAHARWSPERAGLALARLVVSLLVGAGAPVTVVIDDTLFGRLGYPRCVTTKVELPWSPCHHPSPVRITNVRTG